MNSETKSADAAPSANPPAATTPLAGWYLLSIATFMLAAGIQMVLVPYLMAIELKQSAARFGLTQMLGQLPILMFLMFGGWLADRVDPRLILMRLHGLALIMPLVLLTAYWQGLISEQLVLLYTLAWGLVSAFVMPARDGLLRKVAGMNVQRMVGMALGVQFGTQMLGQAVGGRAQQWGVGIILILQIVAVGIGIYVASSLPERKQPGAAPRSYSGLPSVPATIPAATSLWHDLLGGLAVIFANPTMRTTFLLTIGMGVFFGGVYMVALPLAIRDLYAGSAPDIALGYMTFGAGTLISILTIARRGGLRRPGRGLILALATGGLALVPITFVPGKWLFYLCVFAWGLSAGVAMTMSRTILQEHAPASHQSRVMAAFLMSSVGGGPPGSLLMGAVIGAFGVSRSLWLPILGVLLTTLVVIARHSIWPLRSRSHGSESG